MVKIAMQEVETLYQKILMKHWRRNEDRIELDRETVVCGYGMEI